MWLMSHQESGTSLVSSNGVVKPGIEPGTTGLQEVWFIPYTTATLDLFVVFKTH